LKNGARNLLILFFLFFYTNGYSKIIYIDKNSNDLNILKDSTYLLDKESSLNIEHILKNSQKFKSIKTDFLNFGYIFKDTVWIKFILKNSSKENILKYLVINEPNIYILNFYTLSDGYIEKINNGVFYREKFKKELFFKFPLALSTNEKKTFYLELKPLTHSLHFQLNIQSYEVFKEHEISHQLALTLFFSILIVVFIYNLSIAINSENNIHYYYVFFIFTIFIHHLSLTGMINYVLFKNLEILRVQNFLPLYYLGIVVIAMFLFVKKFLNLEKYKYVYRPLQLIIATVCLLIVFNSKENYLLYIMTPLAIVFAIYLEIIGIYLFFNTKEKYAKYFVFIWGFSLMGMVITMLYYVGVLSKQVPYLFETTILIEIFSFSIILAKQIDQFQREKTIQDKILQEQLKLASMGGMIQNISHQWKQPLSEINAVMMKIDTDYYKKKLTEKTLEINIERVELLTQHMSDTIDCFNNYFKQNKKTEIECISDTINQSLSILDTRLKDVRVKVNIDDIINLKINAQHLIQVMHILVNNSLDIFNQKELVYKKIYITVRKYKDTSIIEVEDNAGGIDEKNIEKIFEPYFTTKFKSNGVGIGLYMAKKIVTDSLNGLLSVSNTKEGAKFTITI